MTSESSRITYYYDIFTTQQTGGMNGLGLKVYKKNTV